MAIALVSEKGQITLPAEARKRIGIKARSRVEVEVRGQEIVVRPLQSISDVAGVFREAARGKSLDWKTIRAETERRVAEEVANEGL